MIRSSTVLLTALLALSASARAETYDIDQAHSSANFTVKHMMVSNVRGRFTELHGTVHYDPNNVAASKVEATIETKSISTDNDRRDKHLRSPDFFDVEKFPTIQFVSTSVERAGESRLKVNGNLTMHGVTKPVTLDVDGPTAPVVLQGTARTGATATTKISRKDFGLIWNKILEAGGVAVGDEITIELDLELAAEKAK